MNTTPRRAVLLGRVDVTSRRDTMTAVDLFPADGGHMRCVVLVAVLSTAAQAQDQKGALDAAINRCNDADVEGCKQAASIYETLGGPCVGQTAKAYDRACKRGDKSACKKERIKTLRAQIAGVKAEKIDRVLVPETINETYRKRTWTEVQDLDDDKKRRLEVLRGLLEETMHPGTYEQDEYACRSQMAWNQPQRVLINTKDALENATKPKPGQQGDSAGTTK